MYTFEHVLSSSGREDAFRLRYEIYCEEKQWLDPTQYSDMLEQDEYDEGAEIFLAYDDVTMQPVGTIRVIINDNVLLPLPITKHPSINSNFSTSGCVEISRFAVLKSARRGNVCIGLLRIAIRHVLKYYSDFDYMLCLIEDKFRHTLNQLGFELTPVAPSAFWFGDQLVPLRQSIPRLDDCFRRNNPEFRRWFWQNADTMSGKDTFIHLLREGKRNKTIQDEIALSSVVKENSFATYEI